MHLGVLDSSGSGFRFVIKSIFLSFCSDRLSARHRSLVALNTMWNKNKTNTNSIPNVINSFTAALSVRQKF